MTPPQSNAATVRLRGPAPLRTGALALAVVFTVLAVAQFSWDAPLVARIPLFAVAGFFIEVALLMRWFGIDLGQGTAVVHNFARREIAWPQVTAVTHARRFGFWRAVLWTEEGPIALRAPMMARPGSADRRYLSEVTALQEWWLSHGGKKRGSKNRPGVLELNPTADAGQVAGLGSRVGATAIDTVLILAIVTVLNLLFTVVGTALAVPIALAYGAILIGGASGQTVGDRAFGLKVVDHSTGSPIGWVRALRRTAVFLALTITVIGGLVNVLWCLRADNKQSLHDQAANSSVIWV